jgi:hypothetical protein
MIKTVALSDIFPTLPDFFDEWQRLSIKPPTDMLSFRLEDFIDKWQQIGWHPETPEPAREIDVIHVGNFFSNAESAVKAIRDARRNGEMSNVWEVAKLKREEVRVSSVLAWFLSPHGEHGQGSALLSELVKRISSRNPEKTDCPTPEHVCSKSYWVNVESCPVGERESRVDIEIDGDELLLFIEVKIDAPETNNQIERYLEIGEKKSNSRPWSVIFLNPTGKKPEKSPDHPNLFPISWRDVEYAFMTHAKSLDNSLSRNMIQQFAKYISRLGV